MNPLARLGTLEDAALLAELGRRTFREQCQNTTEQYVRSYIEAHFTVKKISRYLNEQSAVFYLLVMQREPIGYALLRQGEALPGCVPESAALLERLYLLEAWTGQRFADVLMARCLDHALHRGMTHLWLTVWEQNRRAIRFYNRWGFQSVGSYDFKIGTEVQKDIVFVKELG